MYRNMNQPGGGFYAQSPVYPQITTPIATPSIFAQTAPTVLPGRMVDKVEDIMIGEVPSDGSLGLFPKQDGSCIYAKSWNNDGTIRTMKFVPMEQDDSAPRQELVHQDQENTTTLASIDEKLGFLVDLFTSPSSPNPKNGVKKNNQNGSDSKDKE